MNNYHVQAILFVNVNSFFMARLTVVKGHIAVGLWGQNLGRFFFIV